MKNTVLAILLVLAACSTLAADVPTPPVVAGICYLTDYADLQESVDECPNGGTVIIPAGVHEIGTVNIFADEANRQWAKVITIQGVGAGHLGQSPPLGHSQWDYLINGYPDSYIVGTFLRGHITVNKGGRLYLRDLAMVGHAEGIAVDYGDNVYMFSEGGFYNVAFGNYETAIRIRKSYYMTLDDISIAGVGIGLDIWASNVLTMSGINIVACGTGADIYGEFSWLGGSVQACENGILVKSNASYLGGIHFEGITGTPLYWDGYGGKVDPCFFASNSNGVIVNGYNNILDLGWVNSAYFTEASQYNRVQLYGPYTDDGYLNLINQ